MQYILSRLRISTWLACRFSGPDLGHQFDGGPPNTSTREEIKDIEYAMLTTPVAQAHFAASYALPASADFNGDGYVDADDLAQWQGDFGLSPESDADGDGDGDSDGEDLLQWQRQLGGTPATTATLSVPEPATPVLLAIGAAMLAAPSPLSRLPVTRK